MFIFWYNSSIYRIKSILNFAKVSVYVIILSCLEDWSGIMNRKLDQIFINNFFEFKSCQCTAVINKEDISPDVEPKYKIKVSAMEDKVIQFAYSSNDGLNLTGNHGGPIEKNILGKLLALPDNDIEKLKDFFCNYGFLAPVLKDEYEIFDTETVVNFIRKIKSTIKLMNSILKKDYKSVFVRLAYLLYSDESELKLSNNTLYTCPHNFTKLVHSYNYFPDLHSNPEAVNLGTYTVFDTFQNKEVKLSVDFINSVMSGYNNETPGTKEPLFKNLLALYCTYKGDAETRYLIDFFFNIQNKFCILKEIEYAKVIAYGDIKESIFDISIQQGLLNSARIVVANEINHNIRGIHPKYDGLEMTTSWKINTLLEALYFSIFYMKANTKIYKECENPNCKNDKFFLVDSTKSNKRYCCDKCRNTAAQHRYRQRSK